MIIDRVTLHHLRMPFVAPFETSFGRITDRVHPDEVAADGLIGWGECVADRGPRLCLRDRGHRVAHSARLPCPRVTGPGRIRSGRFPSACLRPCAVILWPKLGWRWRFGIFWENRMANHYMNYLEAWAIV